VLSSRNIRRNTVGLTIAYRDPAQLKPRPRNPRTHTPKQIKQISASIEQFGFVNPVLLDAKDGIIAGHGRVDAAKLLGMTDIPTVRVDHLTPAQIRAYVIADNKLAENAGWDRELLTLELRELSVELNFDVTVTGFETAEVDLLVGELDQDKPNEVDNILDIDRSQPAVSRPGDLWRIGNHNLFCGDALDKASYQVLLGSKKAQMIFTDPPYNVPIGGNVSGLGRVQHREFAMASGEMTQVEFTKFLKRSFERLTAFSTNGSMHFICMDWRHLQEVLDGAKPYSELKNLCVWAKTNAGMGRSYRSQHELVFVFKNGSAPHINNVELGRFGRSRSNVWNYAGVNSFGKERDAELAMHPTVKPLALVSDAILDCSKRGGIVLDAFAGSGTTLIAAEKTGRRGYGIEIDTYYADTIIRRLSMYGLEAVHAETEKTFREMTAKRLALEGPRHAKEKNSKIKNSKNQKAKAAQGRCQERKGR
jgi:DNA modification methylase